MKSFKAYLNDTLINEGGNCPVIDRETGKVLDDADRIDTSNINRKKLQSSLLTLFKVLNTKYQENFQK